MAARRDPEPPWETAVWAEEWCSSAEDSPDELLGLWQAAVARSRSRVGEALADGGLDRRATGISGDWGHEPPSLRWILVHMIEEYARHNGHAGLLREFVDGATGE